MVQTQNTRSEARPDPDSVCVKVTESKVTMGFEIFGGHCISETNCENTKALGPYDAYIGEAYFKRKVESNRTSPCETVLDDHGMSINLCECEDKCCPDNSMIITITGTTIGMAQPGAAIDCTSADSILTNHSESFNLCDDEDLLRWKTYSTTRLREIIDNEVLFPLNIDFVITNVRQKCFPHPEDKVDEELENDIREFKGGWSVLALDSPIEVNSAICAIFGCRSDNGNINLKLPGGADAGDTLAIPSKLLGVCNGKPCGLTVLRSKQHTYSMEDFLDPDAQKAPATRALVKEIIGHLNRDPRGKLCALTKATAPELVYAMEDSWTRIARKYALRCVVNDPITMYDVAELFKNIVKNISSIDLCEEEGGV
jgi:hypothetical protein